MGWPPDRDAFTALYHEHYPAVYRFVLYMTGDRIQATEITQDVFVWLIHHPGQFDDRRGNLAAFLGGVARKFLHRLHRNESRWVPLHESAVAHGDFVAGIERDQEAEQLHLAISALPERYREAVVLCDLQSRSYEEAAEIMGCAIGTVRSRLHRARELLAAKMQRRREGQRCL